LTLGIGNKVMELTGNLGSDDRKIFEKFLVPINEEVTKEIDNLPLNKTKDALIEIHQGLVAITFSIVTLCEQEKTSSQATASLMRTLIDGCLTAFAFCKNPKEQAELYINFRAVLDFRFACCQEKHLGCPLADTSEDHQKIAENKGKARKVLETVGLDFLNKKTPSQASLHDALSKGRHNAFRNTWYSEERKNLLIAEGMEWVYDYLYVRLCSAVHSDSAASKVFDSERYIVFTWSWMLYLAAVYRLVETFHIDLPKEQMEFLRSNYTTLQYKESVR